MKIRIINYLIVLLISIGTIYCADNKSNQQNVSPKIESFQDTYNTKFYYIKNFKDEEICIKYIFDFTKKEKGWIVILTNKDDVFFDDGIPYYKDRVSQIFSFFRHRESLENKGITVNFLENKSISFIIKKENNQTFLSSDFETLTVNTVQNFLDYAEKDESKKETENYIYILYNKDNQEKMKLKYHDKGAWFEVEIL